MESKVSHSSSVGGSRSHATTGLLVAGARALELIDLDDACAEICDAIVEHGARDAKVWEHAGDELIRRGGAARNGSSERQDVEGLYARALRRGRVCVAESEGTTRLVVPVTQSDRTLALLEVDVESDADASAYEALAGFVSTCFRQAEQREGVAQMAAVHRSQAVIEFQIDGTIVDANDNFLDALGYARDEIVGQHHRMFVAPEEAASPEYERFWADLAAGNCHAGEFRRVDKQGKDVWIQASYNPVLDASGKPQRVVKLATDVTERKLRDLELRAASNRIDAMVEAAPFALMAVDRDLVVRFMNPASEKLLAKIEHLLPCRASEVMGQTIDIFHRHPEHQRRLLADPTNLPHTTTITLGEEHVSLLVAPIFDEGEYVGASLTWEIITDKVESEKRQREMQERERRQSEELRAKVDSMLAAVRAAQSGDLTMQVDVSGPDAIGQMGEGLGSFLGELRTSVGGISGGASDLSRASNGLGEISQTLAANAEETSVQAATVSAAAEEVSKSVQTVAAGVEELNASVKEIASNANEAASVATEGVKVAETTNETVAQLGESSAEIGKVIKVITSIAQQTNLLALNATIEAARAGAAGKGFAVVANEVKELAKETARATEDISRKIEAIQGDTTRAVEAIDRISAIINQVNEIQSTIAMAVDEQRTTTNEIGRSIAEAARGSSEIAENITSVAEAARSTTTAASDAQSASEQLQELAGELTNLVSRFQI